MESKINDYQRGSIYVIPLSPKSESSNPKGYYKYKVYTIVATQFI